MEVGTPFCGRSGTMLNYDAPFVQVHTTCPARRPNVSSQFHLPNTLILESLVSRLNV